MLWNVFVGLEPDCVSHGPKLLPLGSHPDFFFLKGKNISPTPVIPKLDVGSRVRSNNRLFSQVRDSDPATESRIVYITVDNSKFNRIAY